MLPDALLPDESISAGARNGAAEFSRDLAGQGSTLPEIAACGVGPRLSDPGCLLSSAFMLGATINMREELDVFV